MSLPAPEPPPFASMPNSKLPSPKFKSASEYCPLVKSPASLPKTLMFFGALSGKVLLLFFSETMPAAPSSRMSFA